MKHEIDPLTQYCTRCGAGVQDVLNGDRAEECEEGVIGISVAARGSRLLDMVAPGPGMTLSEIVDDCFRSLYGKGRKELIRVLKPGDPDYLPPPGAA